jgi:hypothetical protein
MNHYVYLIEKKTALETEQKYYIGVRSCESKIGDDEYMSSSRHLVKDIEKNGKKHYNKIILKRFNNREDAYRYEIEMHEKFDVANNPFFFNKVNQKTYGFGGAKGINHPRYGVKHSDETILKIKLKRQEQKFSKESLDKLKGKVPWNKGKKGFFSHSEEHKRKMSIRSRGNKNSLGKVYTEEEKKRKSELNLGLVWMNDGKRNYRIRPENVDMKKQQGLIIGFFNKRLGV